ncbi:TadE/TadG family type IV pilus assembly protein [Ferroacidibacillus organovorans]|uniref:TadE/TadG family type IV pilus assembly protein n=1 Tax=Ferroacidibacillus organovorans TaxID=1765683 RepID=UPI0015C4B9F6|nr:TadE/TadG family type IV pilus assembly protein [Ferroacidibacillus organovorans]
MVRNGFHTLIRSEKGQALVEFALVIPLFLLLLFGVFDFGRIMWNELTISAASRDAARYASLGATDTQIDAVVVSDCPFLIPSQLAISVSPASGERIPGNPVTVTVSYPVAIDPFLFTFLPAKINLTAQTTMRME